MDKTLARRPEAWATLARLLRAIAVSVLMLVGSSASLPLFAQSSIIPPAPERVVVDQNNVDVTNGTVTLSHTDLSIGPKDYGLTLVRYFSGMGNGWRDSFSGVAHIYTDPSFGTASTSTASLGGKSWSFSDGGVSNSGDGANIAGYALNMYSQPTKYLVTLRDGTTIDYSLAVPGFECAWFEGFPCHEFFVPTSVIEPSGLIVSLHYKVFAGEVRLQSVTNNAGYQIKYTYAGGPDSLIKTGATAINNAVEYCAPTADTCSMAGSWPTVTYSNMNGVDGSPFVVTDALGRQTRYVFSAGSLAIRTPGSAIDNIQYTHSYTWDSQTGKYSWRTSAATIDGNSWSYAYSPTPPGTPQRTVTVTDPTSGSTVYSSSYTAWGWILDSTKDPLNRTTSFQYPCSGINPITFYPYLNTSAYRTNAPEGNAVIPTCDWRGNVTATTLQSKPGSAAIVSTASFPANCTFEPLSTCNRPTASVDGRGAQTDYTYHSTHGGLATETMPAVSVCPPAGSPCVSLRPQKRYSYEQIHAYVRDASGTLVPAPSPIWVLNRVSQCRTSESCVGGPDEVVTSFEFAGAGATNRLAVRGKVESAGGISRRTCYSYDVFGNQISVTTPRAGLGACP